MFTRLYDKVRETPMWLSTVNGDLYAVEYAPQGTVSRPPVVIAAPDGEEHAWAARTLVTGRPSARASRVDGLQV